MSLRPDLEKNLREAIKHFWKTRQKQSKKQGAKTGARDAGARTAVTGGRQMDGFVNLVRDYLCSNGLPKAQVFCGKAVEIPGWYRPEKQWICWFSRMVNLLLGSNSSPRSVRSETITITGPRKPSAVPRTFGPLFEKAHLSRLLDHGWVT